MLDYPGGFENSAVIPELIQQGLNDWVALIETVRRSGSKNFQGPRIPVNKTWNFPLLESLLRGYHDQQVIDLLKYGFPLDRDPDSQLEMSGQNHMGAVRYPTHIDKYIKTEIEKGATIGPFPSIPFKGPVAISPLSTREKRDTDDRRIIMDCSWPLGVSLNDGISKDIYLGEQVALTYPTVDHLCSRVHQLRENNPTKEIYFFKEDLSRCFRQYYVDIADIPLLGYKWRNNYYFDTVLMMGCRIAPAIAQRCSNMVVWIQAQMQYFLLNYVDDFLGAEYQDIVHHAHSSLLNTLEGIGLQRSPKKSVPPTQVIEFIGNLFDAKNDTIGVTDSRRAQLHVELNRWRFKPTATRRQLESLVGKLQFVANCLKPGRIFVSRLLNELRGMQRGVVYELTENARQDVRWWYLYLPSFKGTSVMWMLKVYNPQGQFSVDACLDGAGGKTDLEYYHVTFPPEFRSRYAITHLELWAVVLSVCLWGGQWRNKIIQINSDNKAVVSIVNTGRSWDGRLQKILRELIWWCSEYNLKIHVEHVYSKDNKIPDLLSRWTHGHEVHREFHAMRETQILKRCKIPKSWFKFVHSW